MNYVKSLAKQFAPKGIRVNGVAPGPIWTPLQVSGGAIDGEAASVWGRNRHGPAGSAGRACFTGGTLRGQGRAARGPGQSEGSAYPGERLVRDGRRGWLDVQVGDAAAVEVGGLAYVEVADVVRASRGLAVTWTARPREPARSFLLRYQDILPAGLYVKLVTGARRSR